MSQHMPRICHVVERRCPSVCRRSAIFCKSCPVGILLFTIARPSLDLSRPGLVQEMFITSAACFYWASRYGLSISGALDRLTSQRCALCAGSRTADLRDDRKYRRLL